MLCYIMLLCYVMLCYVMLCYVMLCYVMLCYIDYLYKNYMRGYSVVCSFCNREVLYVCSAISLLFAKLKAVLLSKVSCRIYAVSQTLIYNDIK